MRLSLFSVVIAAIGVETTPLKAQGNWRLYEETSIRGTVSGTIRQGHIFRTLSRHVYEVAEYVYLYVYEYAPSVTVLTDGALYRLAIEGFDETLLARCLNCSTRTTGPSTPRSQVTDSPIVRPVPSEWSLYEQTYISGTLSGVIQMGYIFKTVSGNYYEVAEPIVEVVVEVMPEVTVLRGGSLYRLIIEGFDAPILCTRLGDTTTDSMTVEVVESRVDGESEGFNGETVFKLRNGQIWLQTDGYYRYRYKYAPEVLIYRSKGGWKLRLEGIDRAVTVRPLT